MAEKKKTQKPVQQKTEELVAWKPSMPLSFEAFHRHLNKKITKDEALHLVALCKKNHLDPFKIPPDVHIIKYSDKDPAALVVGYQVYLRRAEKMILAGKSKGYEKGTIVKENTDIGQKGYVHKAWCRIHRPDWKVPFYHEVYFDEYAQYKKQYRNGQVVGEVLNRFWNKSPVQMLEKVAMGQAHRLCFPVDFEDLGYFAEEFGLDSSERIPEIKFGESEKVEKGEPKLHPDDVIDGEVVEEENNEMGLTEDSAETAPETTTETPEISTEPVLAEKLAESEGKDIETAEKVPETALESPTEQIPLVGSQTQEQYNEPREEVGDVPLVLKPINKGLETLAEYGRDTEEIEELLISRINTKFHAKKPERKTLMSLNETERAFAMRAIEITIQSEKDKKEGRKKP